MSLGVLRRPGEDLDALFDLGFGNRGVAEQRPPNDRGVAAKVRTGPPSDDEADDDHPVWAGNVPIRSLVEAPVDDPRLKAEIARPD